MFRFNYHATDNLSDLITTLDRYADAGIDPAFDGEMDEMERQFAEYRLAGHPDHHVLILDAHI